MEEDVGRVSDEVLVGVEPELVRRGGDAAMPLAPTHDHPLQLFGTWLRDADNFAKWAFYLAAFASLVK